MMKFPKLLPWQAHRAGVPLERAEALWRQAVQQATHDNAWVGDNAYWRACEDNFLALLETERAQHRSYPFAALLRAQHHIGRLPLLALEDITTALRARWRQQAWPRQSLHIAQP